jgi:DNA repair exonuclease SbcCD ATPase subunit
MKLTRLRVEQFRAFRQPLEITGLHDGINLFTGPNEAGKSTLVAAIRAAFLERHRSGSVDDLRPRGDGSASPTVELDFSLDGTDYRLAKRFLGKKRCTLQIGSRQLDGSEAEDHLAELLGFRHAGRGASTSEHWGIPGLLWVQQGGAQEVRDPVGHATDHLRSALNASLGEIASSGGEIIDIVEAQRNELLTPATGAPRGSYAEALRRQAALAASVEALDADIATYRQKVDRLATVRREHEADAAEQPWAGFRAQEQAARARLEEARSLEAGLAQDRQRAEQLARSVQLLRSQLDAFTAEEQALERRKAALDAAAQALASARTLVEQWRARRREADARYDAARATLQQARRGDLRRSLARELDERRRTITDFTQALSQAEGAHARALAAQRLAAESAIADADLAALREQQRRITELQIQQAAVATRVRYALDDGRALRIGGSAVSGSGERQLVEATAIELPGLGRLDILPGGADLPELGRREADLRERRDAILLRLGLASVDDAESRRQAHARHQADAATAIATLKALAPQGVERLRTDIAAQQARVQEAEQALGRLPEAGADGDATRPVVEAESQEEQARESAAAVAGKLAAADAALANAQAAFDAATRELAHAQAVLDAPERAQALAASQRNLLDARAEQAALAARIDALAQQVSAARPDILQQDVERFGRSAEQLERGFSQRRDELTRLDVELQTAGALGLDERRAEAARDLAQVTRRVLELARRARALDHLFGLLRNRRRALTQRLQAPLQAHLNHYLQLLFPGAVLEIDENLSPGPLTRDGGHGAESELFETLSFGAREQTGIISRLAYADLLREAGRPTLIILDDVLVHSDGTRLAQMKRVLFDAATRHQILLFTCHPANWRDLGVSPRAIDALRAAGPSAPA